MHHYVPVLIWQYVTKHTTILVLASEVLFYSQYLSWYACLLAYVLSCHNLDFIYFDWEASPG